MQSPLFLAGVLFGEVRFLKSATFFSAKVSASLVRAFSLGSFFYGKVIFSKVSFSAKVLASPQFWRFGKSVSSSKTKSGL